MSGWGKLDVKAITGNVMLVNGSAAVANATGETTVFLSEITSGDYISFGANVTKYYVLTVNSNTSLTLSSVYSGTNANINAIVQQGPSFVINTVASGNAYSIQKVYGVDSVEVGVVANKSNNFSQPGWVHHTSYNDAFGARRVKTETLVAMSKNFNRNGGGSLQTDADDDTLVKDA